MNLFLHHTALYQSIEKIYSVHAANMYGCIFKILQDKPKAEKILSTIFQELHNEHLSYIQTKTAPIWFIKYATKATFTYLKQESASNEYSPFVLERIAELKKDIAQAIPAMH
jgi:hypothetical protein